MGNLKHGLDEFFMYFDTAFTVAGHGETFRIAGTSFDCRTSLRDYRATLPRALVGGGRATADGACRILIGCADDAGLPHLRWAEPFFQERVVEDCLSNTRYRLHHSPDLGFWQVFDRESGRGVQLMQGPGAFPAWDPGSPLRNFLHWNFAGAGSGLVHAGTLATDGIGMLFAGPGGSGKSGTVLAGILHGLSTVGDDYVLTTIHDDKVTARPLFKTLKQDPAGMKRLKLDGTASVPRHVNWQGKHQFTISDIAPGAATDRIDIRAICLPRITGARTSSLRPATSKEAFLALAPSGVSQMPGDRDKSFALCAVLARVLPCYRLDLGHDVAEIAGRIQSFIRQELA